MKMKKVLKKGMGILTIYCVVIALTLVLTDRIERLESREDVYQQNTNIAFNLK